MLVDSHCHINLILQQQPSINLDDILKESLQAGVGRILYPAVNLDDSDHILEICRQYSFIYGAVGIHPSVVLKELISDSAFKRLKQIAKEKDIIAIGETGLDFSKIDDLQNKKKEENSFLEHIEISFNLNKPLIIHSRAAEKRVLEILRSSKRSENIGVMHSFCGDNEIAKQALDLGLYISFSGIVTFNNANSIREVAKALPIDSILVETDAPYLTPNPLRGKINRPAYVKYIADYIAELRNIDKKKFAKIIDNNFNILFSLDRVDV